MSETALNEIIKSVIDARGNKVDRLKVRKKELILIKQNLEMLQIQGEHAVSMKNENFKQLFECNPGLEKLLGNPQTFQETILAYEDAILELDHLIDRFDRKSINISVVGDSKAGKSKFLQTVSGLGNECIPSFVGSFCTGVSSIIENRNDIEGVKGVFTFKTEKEMLREINDKLKRITGGRIQIASLEQVQNLSAESLKEKLVNESEEGNIPDFITMYVDNFKEWACFVRLTEENEEILSLYHLIKENGEYICIDKKEIQKYVAKHDGGDIEVGGTNAKPLYRYIAVKKAVIYARFALTSVNRIRLVDTVGLGDLAVGTTEKMYEAIDRDSDAVLYFFRPEANKGGVIDERTYRILNCELYPRYKEQNMQWWMAVVVNHITGKTTKDKDNFNECISFMKEFATKVPNMEQNVAFREIVDVSEPNEVREKCIVPILKSISEHLSEIDKRFERNTKEKIKTANQIFHQLKQKFSELQVPASKDLIDNKFRGIFSGFIEGIHKLEKEYLTTGNSLKDMFLEESLKQVSMLKGEKNEKTETVTTASICQSLDYVVEPDSKRIRAFGELQWVVRTIASRDSMELNQVERQFKRKLADLFLHHFGFDPLKCVKSDKETFFLTMAEQLFGNRRDLAILKDAFLAIHSFQLKGTTEMTKILFHDKAELYLTCKDMVSKEEKDFIPKKGIVIIKDEKNIAADGNENHSDSNHFLVEEMNQKLTQFIEDIQSLEFYKNPEIVPISTQILSELSYFLRFFDLCYHREWAIVLNQQLREGYIFTEEKQKIDNLSKMFDDFKQMVNQAVVDVSMPQSI